ncbi:hypothetical protein [Flavobacterium sp.]|uniref:hypothetical protein n=2 Tax=Flavobacterium sp. TaxID=239 RepID=UPI0040478A6E
METKKRFTIYTLEEGDSLASVSEKLGKTNWEVAHFHNCFAKDDALIGVAFPATLQVLYIEPNFHEKEVKGVPKVSFVYDGKIAIKPIKVTQEYHVTTSLDVHESTLKLSYDVSVTFLKKLGAVFLFKIHKKQILEIDSFGMLEELEAKIQETLYPLEIEVDDDGFFIGIANYEQILERWQTVKEKLLDEFDGVAVLKTILFYDAIFFDALLLFESLQNDLFLKTYFSGLFCNYTLGYTFENCLDFPILKGCKNAKYKVHNKIDPYLNDEVFFTITREGTLEDERVLLDFEEKLNEPYFALFDDKQEKAMGGFASHYVLNNTTHSIENISLECTLELEKKRTIKMTVRLLD